MAFKRFTDTEKWTKNKWFRNLPKDYKVLWMYICDMADNVGVWEEDLEFASMIIGCGKFEADQVFQWFGDRIKVFDGGRKWWIVSFCDFQHGELSEDTKSKPHIRYINDLKAHNLWIEYSKGINTLKDKGKGKEEEKEEDKDKDRIQRGRFVKPTVEEVTAYFAEIGYLSDGIGERFVDYYESKAWVVGKSPMKDWRAACRTWKRNGNDRAESDTRKNMTPTERNLEKFAKEKLAGLR